MKKIITLLSLMLMVSAIAFAQDGKYLRVKIQLKNNDISRLAKAGIPLDAGFYNSKEGWYQTEIVEADYNKVIDLGFATEVMVDDLESWYAGQNEGINPEVIKQQAMRAPTDYPVPDNFELGSCGGFSTIDECYAQLEYMYSLYPDLITLKEPISDLTTHEGRPVYYVKISDNPYEIENEPQVLYTGMHHAREPIGMQHLLYYMYYLLENYATNPEIRDLVDNTEMYFIPILNPDGYARNITTNPNGGGMWRKNRRMNAGGSMGVDLNRNYGLGWGYDDEGSSPIPTTETYRGPAAFSEPETQMIKEFCEEHDFKIALNYHSYSNLLLYPWGYIPEICPDDFVFSEYGKRMTAENNYTYGPGSTTIYPSNGGSDDWMYGEQDTKAKIFAYTPEVGSQNDGFWPYVSRIIPLCQENMLQSILAARFSGPYAEVVDLTPIIIPELQGNVKFEIKRLGQSNATFTVSLIPLSDNFVSTGDPLVFEGLNLFQKLTDSIAFQLKPGLHNGDTLKYAIQVDNGLYIINDTIERYYGESVVIFSDDFPDTGKWNGQWGLYSGFPYSAPYSIADSPLGLYANNTNTSFSTNETINLTNASLATLNFYARWRIEAGYDYVQLKISVDNGQSWTPLKGKFTRTGTSYQAGGQPVYDGIQGNWVREEIDLSPWSGQQILLRFSLRSDANTIADGFFFDDITVTIIDVTTQTHITDIEETFSLSVPRPNPATTQCVIAYKLADVNGKIVLSDSRGAVLNEISLKEKTGEILLNTSNLSPGVYFYTLVSGERKLITRKLIK